MFYESVKHSVFILEAGRTPIIISKPCEPSTCSQTVLGSLRKEELACGVGMIVRPRLHMILRATSDTYEKARS